MAAQIEDNKPKLRLLVVLAGLALLLATLYGAASAVVLKMALVPVRHAVEASPMEAGLEAEAVAFQSEREPLTLRGFYVQGGKERAIILLHGLDSNCWRGFHRDLTRDYVIHGYSVLAFSLRGHGDSDGDALGLGWKEREDVRGGVNFLLSRGFNPGSIGIHGTSYGAATALLSTAYIPEVGAVVADSAFADFRDLMDVELKRRVGFSGLFKPGILQASRTLYGIDADEATPLRAVTQVAPRPILFMHGALDQRIPVEHMKRLVERAGQRPEQAWVLPGAGHTEAYKIAREEFLQRVFGFFDSSLKGPQLKGP